MQQKKWLKNEEREKGKFFAQNAFIYHKRITTKLFTVSHRNNMQRLNAWKNVFMEKLLWGKKFTSSFWRILCGYAVNFDENLLY